MASKFWDVEWDESAVRVCRVAREESFTLGDEYIGTQHFLLAVALETPSEEHGFEALSRECPVSAVVEVVGIRTPDDVLISPGGQTPRVKLVLQRAMERAFRQSRRVIRRDIWHGLLVDEESECLRVLRLLGLDRVDELRQVLAD